LLGRDLRNTRLALTGAGLIIYALAMVADLLSRGGATDIWDRLRWSALLLPAVCWTGALVHLLPEQAPGRDRLIWLAGLILPAVAAGVVVTGLVIDPDHPAAGLLVAAIAVLLPMMVLMGYIWVSLPTGRDRRRSALGAPLTGTLFLALSSGLVVASLGWLDSLPRTWVLVLLGVDLGWLGVSNARFDALDQGETLILDIARSVDAALLAALLFGGQVVLAMATGPGATAPMIGLPVRLAPHSTASPSAGSPIFAALGRSCGMPPQPFP